MGPPGLSISRLGMLPAVGLSCGDLQHCALHIIHRRQLLGALHAELQSNQPATFLAAEFDGSLCK